MLSMVVRMEEQMQVLNLTTRVRIAKWSVEDYEDRHQINVVVD